MIDQWFKISKFNNEDCFLQVLSIEEFNIYKDIIKKSKKIKKYYYIENISDKYHLYFNYENKTEYKIKNLMIHKIYLELFDKTSYEQTIKKENMRNMDNIYVLLDNKFTYFEMRIREVELNPIKNDIDWIILSKYHILLDSKIYLYDLQQDLFKFIDKEQIVKYGLIPYRMNQNLYSNSEVLMDYNFYYGPIAMLYVREYMMMEEFDMIDEISKLDEFNQKYFCFMIIYVLILNINLEIIPNHITISNYLNICQKIKDFIKKYKALIEK